MAFAQVEATNHSAEASNTTSHTVALPASIQSGETLLVFFSCDYEVTVTFPEGWTKIFQAAVANQETLAVAWRKADSEEGASITVTTDSSQESVHISYRISGALDPTMTPPEVSTGVSGTSANPDPDSLSPAGGSDEYLWIALEGNNRPNLVTVYPTNYTNEENYVSSEEAGACAIGIARRELETDSEDPSAFTIDTLDYWVACTVAVYPAVIVGWTGKISGVTNPAKIMGVDVANIAKVKGVA